MNSKYYLWRGSFLKIRPKNIIIMYLTGIVFTFFLVLVLLGKKRKNDADRILAIWLVIMGIHLTLFYLYFSGKHLEFPYLLNLERPLPLMHGPLLYLYTTSLTKQLRKKRYEWLHFLPVVLVYIMFADFFMLSPEGKIAVYQSRGHGYETRMAIVRAATNISGIVYILLSFIELRNHKRNIINEFSYLEKINLSWLRYLTVGLCVIWLFVILDMRDEYVFGAVVLYILFIGYYGIRQVGIFGRQEDMMHPGEDVFSTIEKMGSVETEKATEPILEEEPEAGPQIVKYRKSGLNYVSASEIHQKLNKLMTEEKLYKNPELSLTELSQKLNVNSNILSQTINSIEQKNFYDYINTLRIEEFKQLTALEENQKYTLLALAFECGFNSKTSFNRNFKKINGISPTEYLNKVNVDLLEEA